MFDIKEVSKEVALEMVQTYHYSNTLPKLNKHYLGVYLHDELVGVITLGWGTRPKHTIQLLFPSLDTSDYFEIGRMCMTEEMPKNSESQMISALRTWIKKNHPEIKVLFSWSDGMMGKPGYVYQACSFYYAGHSVGEMYVHNGVKIHVRQMKSVLFPNGTDDKRLTIRPTLEQMRTHNILHFKGKQYRYFTFLCNKWEKKRLLKELQLPLLPYPKAEDLTWRVRNLSDGKWVDTTQPPITTDIDQSTKDIVHLYSRHCTECNKPMSQGYCVEDGLEYFCSDECLNAWYSQEEYTKLCEQDLAYWTEWEN